jgi:3-hydroxyisobutyrate dehydrogenase
MTAPRIGWIGTGRMGAALVARLLDAGCDVAVYNRTAAKARPLAERGATVVERPADLADRDVVFVMVSASADLEEVTTGDGGVLTTPGHAPGVLVDSSTVSVEASASVRREAGKRGTEFLAAPVSGNPKVVAAGKLTFAVSGPRAAYDRVEPLIALLGRGSTYVGDGEVARLVKICHNVLLGVVTQCLAEITVLAEKGGTSRAAFPRYKTPAFVNLDFTPTFTMPLLRKDFELGLDAARELDAPMPVASATAQLVASAVGAGHVDEDFATLLLEQARRAGMTLAPEDVAVDDGLGS